MTGKVGSFDLTYAGAYLDRVIHSSADYTDYAEQYDSLYAGAGGIAQYFYFTRQCRPAYRSVAADRRRRPFHQAEPGTAPRLAGGEALPHRRRAVLPVADPPDPPGLSGARPGRQSLGQRPSRHAVADAAGPHRPRLCGLRRGELRPAAERDAHRRRARVQVRQLADRLLRLRPRPQRPAVQRRRQLADRRRRLLHRRRADRCATMPAAVALPAECRAARAPISPPM